MNPKRADCTYPDKDLAGVGVALKLVQALCQKAGRDVTPGRVTLLEQHSAGPHVGQGEGQGRRVDPVGRSGLQRDGVSEPREGGHPYPGGAGLHRGHALAQPLDDRETRVGDGGDGHPS